ncbi:MAG: hypothetical protein ACRC2T_18075 [Thermoguttaceae bacterium]
MSQSHIEKIDNKEVSLGSTELDEAIKDLQMQDNKINTNLILSPPNISH